MKNRLLQSYLKLKKTNILSNFFNLSGIQISNTLLLVLSIPVITRAIGLDKFGIMMFASRFAQLAGTVINYGTNQSGVRDIASHAKHPGNLGKVLYNTLYIRTIFFVLFLFLICFLQIFHLQYFKYILLAVPIVLAEVVNPLFFYIGTEKLKVFNIFNLICNVVTILIIIFFITNPEDAGWVNFILGSTNTLTYSGLLFYLIMQFKLSYQSPVKTALVKIFEDNFYLTVNNISVQLQQSIMIFTLTKWGNPSLLGAYSLCDRIIGQCRNLIITISNAVYPTSVQCYNQGIAFWNNYRKKLKYTVGSLFFAGSVLLFLLADFIIYTLSKEHNTTAVIYLKTMAIVPTIAALNFANVLDQLLKNNTIYIFIIAVILLLISGIISYILLHNNYLWIGTFTIITEAGALLMYEFAVKKRSLQKR